MHREIDLLAASLMSITAMNRLDAHLSLGVGTVIQLCIVISYTAFCQLTLDTCFYYSVGYIDLFWSGPF